MVKTSGMKTAIKAISKQAVQTIIAQKQRGEKKIKKISINKIIR